MKTPRAALLPFFCLLAFAQQRDVAQRRVEADDDHQAAREKWFYGQRAYPLGHIPTGARLNAIRDIEQIDVAARTRRQALRAATVSGGLLDATTDSANWTLIGPRPTDSGSNYVTAGRVNAIAIDPRDNNVVYMGAAEGGVWKTVDGGANWKPLTDNQPTLANGALALDPTNPDIVYVGTGEENFAVDSYYGAGILKSTDGGAHWTNLVGPFLRARIGFLAIHPTNGQILLCTTQTGVWRSTDGAVSWKQVLSGAAGTSAAFDPTDPNIAYAALGTIRGNSQNGVYRSTDGGQTWKLTMGTGANSLPTANVGRIEIAMAPSTPTTLYVSIQNSSDSTFGVLLGIYKTTDSGATWNQLTAAPPDFCAKQCWYDMALRVHPSNPDIVFGGGLRVIRTLDGGATFSTLSLTGPNGVEMHVDQHNLVFTRDAAKLYIANDGGMYSTSDISSPAVSWANLNETLAITQFYPGLSIHPTDANFALGGTQDNGPQRYTGKISWENLIGCDGGWSTIDSSLPSTVHTTCQDIDIFTALDNGDTPFPSSYGINQTDRSEFISPLVSDPNDPQVLYFGTFRLWRSKDGGGRWNAFSPDLTDGSAGTVRTIGIAPSDGNTIYVGSSDVGILSAATPKNRVQVTVNANDPNGATWVNRTVGLPPRVITQIRVDPIDGATAYAVFSGFTIGQDTQGHVFKTTDAGASWTDISGNLPNLPVNDIAIDPDLPDTLYVATDAGVMATTNRGASWSTLGNGLPNVVVEALVLHRPSRILRAATHGRSVWDIALPLSTPSLQPVISSLSPQTVNSGSGSFSLSVTGSNFVAGTTIRWNGQNKPTRFVDNKHLAVDIIADDVAAVGRVSILAFNASRGGGASIPVTLTVGPAPLSASNAVGGAAPNPAAANAIAQRGIASIFGVNLAHETALADIAPPLPFSLGGTTVIIGGNPVPLFFVSPGQINFQVPFLSVTRPTQVPLTITQGALSTTISVVVSNVAPALFTTNQAGTGQASALIAGTASIAAPAGMFPGSRPAKKGESVSLFATGLGDVRNRPALGGPSPVNPLSSTLLSPSVTIGDVPASVSFSGLAPGFVGLYQVNVQVPATAPSGPAVPVALTIGGASANPATIAIE